jgi:hypothetical protein
MPDCARVAARFLRLSGAKTLKRPGARNDGPGRMNPGRPRNSLIAAPCFANQTSACIEGAVGVEQLPWLLFYTIEFFDQRVLYICRMPFSMCDSTDKRTIDTEPPGNSTVEATQGVYIVVQSGKLACVRFFFPHCTLQ